MKRNERGITLIALVVTIVVLLILAGVSISMLTGENGIIRQATESRIQTQIGEEKEAINLAMQALVIDKVYNPNNYQDGIINDIQLKNEMDKSTPKPVSITLNDTSKNLTVIFDESRGNRTYIVGQDGIIQSEEVQTPVEISSIYAKLYSYNDGSGDVLELSSNPNFEDTSGIVTLKEDYGDIGGNHYYFDYVENETDSEYYYEEKGLLPPWIEKITETGDKYTSIYYIPNEYIIEVKIIDKIEPVYTSYLFYDLPNLKNIENVENIDTKNTIDMKSMFEFCDSLTNLDLSSWDVSNVIDLNYMFAFSGVISLNLNNWNTSNVTNMSAVFYMCKNLQTLNLNNWNTSNVTLMGGKDKTDTVIGMFAYCYSLTNLDLSDFDTSKVTNMASMFLECNSLTNLNLSSFNTENVINMTRMFDECTSLTNLNLSSFNTENVIDMTSMFDGCTSLTNLNLSSFKTNKVTSMYRMFAYCCSLTNLDLSNFDTSKVIDMSGMFTNCENLISLNISSFDTSNVTIMGGFSISEGMFGGCKSLEELDLSSFDTRKVTDMRCMFSGCSNLMTIYVGLNWSTTNADITHMFNNCGTSSVTQI